jgi:hypothetical protein
MQKRSLQIGSEALLVEVEQAGQDFIADGERGPAAG